MNRALPTLLLAVLAGGSTARASEDPAERSGASVSSDAEAELAALEVAFERAPESPLLARDLAIARARAGRHAEALEALDRARALGDVDPETETFRAVLLARLGQPRDALRAARAAESWEADLVGAALGDAALSERALAHLDEGSSRGALSRLVLSAYAGGRGASEVARLLASGAETRARELEDAEVWGVARTLGRRLEDEGRARVDGRLRASIDHATNPFFRAGRVTRTALRLGLSGEVAAAIPVGRVRIESGARVDQHLMLTDRSVNAELDLTALSVFTGFELPIGTSPSSARVGVAAQFADVFGDLFRVHYATALEGGPYLVFPVGASLVIEGGVYGVAVDFIDRSPRDALISSQNRDRVGQRAALAFSYSASLFEARIEGAFLNDGALGDAFDALGGMVAGRVRARPGGGVLLSTGLAVTARDFGPVGDRAIIGPAATRTEVRTVVELGARVPFSEHLAWVVEDVWIRNNARREHRYTENVLSMGVEAVW